MSRMENVKVSVCMITFQHEQYIEQAIEGILMQKTNYPFELVIGEDCGNDNTRKICENYANKYPDLIRLLPSDSNLGVMPNFIRTLKACKGEYIAICEGDDFWLCPDKLQKQIEFLEANQEYVLCFHDAVMVNENGEKVSDSKLKESRCRDYGQKEMVQGQLIPTLTSVFRNKIDTISNSFNENVINGDTFLFALLAKFGKAKYLNMNQAAAYRIHEGGVWSKASELFKLKQSLNTYIYLFKVIDLSYKEDVGDIVYRKYCQLLEGYKNVNQYIPFLKYYTQFLVFRVRQRIRKELN